MKFRLPNCQLFIDKENVNSIRAVSWTVETRGSEIRKGWCLSSTALCVPDFSFINLFLFAISGRQDSCYQWAEITKCLLREDVSSCGLNHPDAPAGSFSPPVSMVAWLRSTGFFWDRTCAWNQQTHASFHALNRAFAARSSAHSHTQRAHKGQNKGRWYGMMQ